MVEPFAQGFGKPSTKESALHQHVHVERNAAFELGELERFISLASASTVRARLDDEAQVLADSSCTSPTSGSFLSLTSSAIFSTRRDFCTATGSGDDDLPAAAAGVLLVSAPAPKRPRP
jgi:hypothetical protein